MPKAKTLFTKTRIAKIKELIEHIFSTMSHSVLYINVMDSSGNIIISEINRTIDTQSSDKKARANLDKGVVLEGLKDTFNEMTKEFIEKVLAYSDEKEWGTYDLIKDDYILIMTKASDLGFLSFCTHKETSLDVVFPVLYLCAEKLVRILTNKSYSLMIPNFYDEEPKLQHPKDISEIAIEEGTFKMKVILAGDSAVGKTTLVTQFVENKFVNDFKSTIGVNLMRKEIKFDKWNTKVILAIYDAAGQHIFRNVRKTYFLNASAGFIVFDVTRPETFKNVEKWYVEAKSASPGVLLVLVGNKIDLKNRVVSKEAAMRLAKKYKMKYLETSALNKDLVDEAFRTMAFLYILKGRMHKIIKH
ncbi:MAG: Rab family GTPase [Promethearchaeota archaeon]